MDVEKGKIYAVLTGDIVRFSRLPADGRLELLRILKENAQQAAHVFKDTILLPIDIFRGDGWQLLVADPAAALRIGVYLRATLRARFPGAKADSRFAIGIGSIDFIPDQKVSEGDGEAYRLSGKALEALPRCLRMTLACGRHKDWETALRTVLHLFDICMTRLSPKQALALSGALEGRIQREIAQLFQPAISQQAVAGHLERSGWRAMEEALSLFENILHELFY